RHRSARRSDHHYIRAKTTELLMELRVHVGVEAEQGSAERSHNGECQERRQRPITANPQGTPNEMDEDLHAISPCNTTAGCRRSARRMDGMAPTRVTPRARTKSIGSNSGRIWPAAPKITAPMSRATHVPIPKPTSPPTAATAAASATKNEVIAESP